MKFKSLGESLDVYVHYDGSFAKIRMIYDFYDVLEDLGISKEESKDYLDKLVDEDIFTFTMYDRPVIEDDGVLKLMEISNIDDKFKAEYFEEINKIILNTRKKYRTFFIH